MIPDEISPSHADSLNLRYEVDKKDIAYLTGLIEAYDEFAVLRTLDESRGLIELLIAPDYLEEVNRLIEALKNEIPIRQLPEGDASFPAKPL